MSKELCAAWEGESLQRKLMISFILRFFQSPRSGAEHIKGILRQWDASAVPGSLSEVVGGTAYHAVITKDQVYDVGVLVVEETLRVGKLGPRRGGHV